MTRKSEGKRSRYVERGAAIEVPDDDFFALLRGAFRLKDPDTTKDDAILDLASKRLQKLFCKDVENDPGNASNKIRSFQKKLEAVSDEKVEKECTEICGSFVLHRSRTIVGLIAFSAVDRDLAKKYRALQSLAKVANLSDRKVKELLSVTKTIHTKFQWKLDRLDARTPHMREYIKSHPYNMLAYLEPVISLDVKQAVLSVKLASEGTWDTSGLTIYGSKGRVSRPYFNKCVTHLECLAALLGLKKTLVTEIYSHLGVGFSQQGLIGDSRVGVNDPLSSPLTQELHLSLATSIAALLRK